MLCLPLFPSHRTDVHIANNNNATSALLVHQYYSVYYAIAVTLCYIVYGFQLTQCPPKQANRQASEQVSQLEWANNEASERATTRARSSFFLPCYPTARSLTLYFSIYTCACVLVQTCGFIVCVYLSK